MTSVTYDVCKFNPNPSAEYVCVICHCVIHEPRMCCCHHIFCKVCIETWLSRSSTCPACRRYVVLKDLQNAPPLVQNVLNSLTMDCDYKAKGCSDPVIKENFPSHIQSCEYRSVHCPHNGCQVETTMRDLPKHKQCCVFRIEQCGLQCGLPFPVHKMLDHDCVTALKDRIIELNGILYRHQAILKWLRQKLNLSHMPHNSQGAQLEAYKMMVADINRYWPAEQPIPVLLCGEFLAAPDKLFSGSSCDSAKEVSQAATQSGNSILETLISEEITLGQMLTSAEQDLPRDIVHRAGTPHPDHGFLDDRGDNLEAVEDSNSVDLNLGAVQWQIMNSEPIPTLSSLDPNRPAQANQTQTLSQRSLYDIEPETHPDQFQSNYDENRSYQSAGSSIDDFSSYSDGEPDTPLPDDVDNRNSPLDNYSMYWSYRHSGTAERTGNRPQHGQSRRHGTSRSRSYSRSRSDSRSRNRNYSRSRSRSDSGSRSRSDSRSRSRSSSRSRSRSDRGFRSRSYSLPRSYSPPRRYSHSSGNSPSGGYNPSRSRSRSSSIQSISSERFINHRASQSRSRSRSLDRDRRLDLSTNHSRSWNHRQIRESRNYSEHSDTNDKFSDQAESEPGNRESERELHSHLTSENSLAIEGHSLRYSHVQLEPEQGMNHLDHVYQATNGSEDLVTQPSNADFLQNSDGCRSDHGRSVDLSSSGYWSPSFNQDLCHTPANRVNTQNREEVWHSPGNHSVHEGGDNYLAYEDVGPIASSALDGCDDPISLTVRSNPDLTSSIVISSPGYLSKHNGDFHSRVLGSRHTETDNSPGRKGKHTSHSYAGCSNIALSETDEENEERDRVQHAYDGGSRVRAKSLMHDAWESSSIASSLDHDLGDDSSTPTGSPQPRTNIEQVGIAASPLDASVKQKVSGNKNSTAKKRKRVHDTRSQQGNDQDSENNLSDSRNEHPPSNAHGSHSEKKPGPSTSHHSKGIKRRSRGSSKGKALLKGKHKSGKSSSNSRKNDVCSKPQVRTRGESTFSPRDGSEPNGGLHEQTGVERDNENSTNLPSTSSGTLGPSLKTDKKTRKKAKKEKTRSQKSNHSDQEDSDGQRHKRNSKKRKADKSKHHKSLKRARLNNTLTDGSSHREMRTRASCHRRQASLQSWNRAKSVTATSTSQSSTAADTAGWRAENTNRMQGRPHPEPHKTKDRLPHAHSMNTEANVRTGTSTGRGRQPDRPAQDDRFQSNEGRVTAVDDVQDSHILRAERGERREPPMTRGRRIMRVENPASLGNSRTQRMEDNLRLVTISDIPVPPSTFELLNQFNNSDESDSTWSPSSSDELE